LKEEQERLKKQYKFVNILFLQSRSLEIGSPFNSLVYSSSFQKYFSISKLEKAFEEIKKPR
jgi:hypothetical protein